MLYSVLDELVTTYNRDLTFDEFKLSVLSKYEELNYLLIQLQDVDISEEVLSDLGYSKAEIHALRQENVVA